MSFYRTHLEKHFIRGREFFDSLNEQWFVFNVATGSFFNIDREYGSVGFGCRLACVVKKNSSPFIGKTEAKLKRLWSFIFFWHYLMMMFGIVFALNVLCKNIRCWNKHEFLLIKVEVILMVLLKIEIQTEMLSLRNAINLFWKRRQQLFCYIV